MPAGVPAGVPPDVRRALFPRPVLRASPEAAARAAEEMPGDPDAAGFFGLIGEVHDMRHAEVLHSSRG